MLTLKNKERGEWIEVGALLVDPKTHSPVDVTGCTVQVVVRSGPASTDPQILTASGGVVDALGGEVSAGFRIQVPGRYFGTLTVDKGGTPGWPVIEQFATVVADCP